MSWRKAIFGLVLVIWALSALSPHFQRNSLEVWMLDVGQGESVLVHEPGGRLLLYDGGPDDSVLQQLGSVLPPWQRRIDLVVLSHDHSDHVTGLIGVLQRYRIGEVWASGATYKSPEFERFAAEIKSHHIKEETKYFHTEECGLAPVCPIPIAFGRATIQPYHPVQDMQDTDPRQPHDATLSIKISFGSESVFLTGDLNEQHEQDMIDSCPPPRCTLRSTILQVPHHGSASGLSPDFLRAVSPRSALIPVGLHNKFNHPRAETLEKLRSAGIPYFRTDLNGRIHAVLGNGTTVWPEHPG